MILSVVSYERKNILFYKKNIKLTKNNTFNVFAIEFFFDIGSKKKFLWIQKSFVDSKKFSLM